MQTPSSKLTGKFLVMDTFGAWFLTPERTWTKNVDAADIFETYLAAFNVASFNYGVNNTAAKVFGPVQS